MRRADQQLTYTEANLGARRTNRVTLPDMKARWQFLERVLGMKHSFSSIQLNSGFNIQKNEQGPESGPVEQSSRSTAWAPQSSSTASTLRTLPTMRASLSAACTPIDT